MVYGSEEDENDALAFLSAISEHDTELIETKFNGVEEQLLQEFSLDDLFPLVAPLFVETPHSCSRILQVSFAALHDPRGSPVDLWEDGGSDDGYVLVKQDDVVDGMTSFMAACLVSIKKTKDMPPDQLQKALRKTFSAEKKKSKIRKAWDETKVIYNVASWGRHCCHV
ncbi:hypothetical protein ACJX0J_027327, partial [Zea mays]